jgi:sugar (pentulose or hexulose) kinase
VARLVASSVFALPSFTDSGGPVPGSGGKGRIEGGSPADAAERAALASLYCALMVSEQLDAVGSRHDIIVDGPFAKNAAFLAVLAALRQGQSVMASDLRNGTTAGAACLALMPEGKLPHVELKLLKVRAAAIDGLAAYRSSWRSRAGSKG